MVTAHVVLAHGAPSPTLVLPLHHLPPGALALGSELAQLRRALAGTPYPHLNKIALYGASGPHRLDYRFVQAMPGGGPHGFDFRAGCGHSLLACVVAQGGGGVTVRAVTTGDTVRCVPEEDGAYTVEFQRAPDAPDTLPTGRPVDLLDGVPVTLVRYGNPYVLVDARHLPPAHDPERALLALRARAAHLLGYAPTSPLPKIAAFRETADGGIAARALTVGGWHPRLALTGATAFAAAGAIDGTVVRGPVTRIGTPGGPVRVSATATTVRVHDKRAHVLARLELPWRIHAKA
ncbi:hypothetical protein KV205_09775 [Streptomyces sp. SKN60]|uniref:hypothetical protein n=1 Tax=Streptomyces sp. SKN60 TaxID=2855506 RepID=UPI002246C753|nr:hypothetical protein [Streptomyces sp. SKN60]MCX2180815.1 hypothetical protein [Streptomyces sp. SKN60]